MSSYRSALLGGILALATVFTVLPDCTEGLTQFQSNGDLTQIIDVYADADGHTRAKRDTNEEQSLPDEVKVSDLSSYFPLNNSHLHLMVHWPGAGSDVMFCLARDTEMKPGATSRFFMSKDNGKTFSDESGRLRIPADTINGNPEMNATITKFYQHPLSSCSYVFADTVHRYIFTSTDCGRSFTPHKLEASPEYVEFDKSKETVFLVHDLADDEKKLYVTKNFGETFSNVQSYVKAFFFEDLGSQDNSVLYVQRLEPDNTTTILSSTNFFERQLDTHVIYTRCKEFELRNGFMFVTRDNSGDGRAGELELLVSMGGSRFAVATFTNALPTLDFHIIDATKEGQVMIVVNHGEALSNVYTSVKITPYIVEFSVSLERVMYYNPRVTWHDSWLSDTAGEQPFADVYKVQGLRGIYVASQIKEKSMTKSEIEPEDLVSLITFDQGAIWSPIQGPETDEEGYPFPKCKAGTKCSLHVSQQLSKRFPSTRSIPLLSSKSAVGIVMATGNMGDSLKQRSNVFMSADAGLSWHQVLKGSYYFNMGDHGGILVAVKYFKTEGPTNELLYSTNDGIKWDKLKFHDKPLRIFGLLTEPGENTTTFTMFGTAHDRTRGIDWIIVTVDLRDVFDRTCTEDDYKRWSPSDGTHGKHRNCILGRKEVYERRAVNTNCYNGLRYERVVAVENCACDRTDYICDFGFKKGDDEGWIKNCIYDSKYSHDPYVPPAKCPPGTTFNRTSGYIKMRGDSCVEGKASIYEPLEVPCPLREESEFLLVSQRKSLFRMNLRNVTEVEEIKFDVAQNVISLDFDMEDNCVMFADIDLDKIFVQCLNGSEARVLVESNLESVEGMSYDWISKSLYFVDGLRKTIELVRVDVRNEGRLRKTILHGKVLGKPRGVAVHPLQGYLFFSDWNEANPIIGRANMDGSNVQTLHSRPNVQWPNGLAVDFIAHRIYWVEAQKDFIASSDLDGSNFKRVIEHNNYMKHPFAVGVYKELMYWDDWHTKSVYVADKNSGKGLMPLITRMDGAMDLKVFSSYHRSGNNSCSSKPCSHLCTPLPDNKYQCLCPDGMKSEDHKCKCPDGSLPDATLRCNQTNGSCQPNEFTCANNYCVPELWKCDGDDDCGDNSDESDCIQDECKEFQFQCNNRKCIPNNWRCDFDDDCGDGSDETVCDNRVCTKDQFKCDNGQCISKKWQCDLEKDCQDGSDEKNCTAVPTDCKDDEFHCPEGGQCLPNSWKCDGDNDCPGGSDESNCDSQTCKDWQFTCDSGLCIFKSWRCDNETDCADGSDEVNCEDVVREDEPGPLTPSELPVPVFPKGQCNEWMFKCQNEQCIPFWWKCDGTPDCQDDSDELECSDDAAGGGGDDGGSSRQWPPEQKPEHQECGENQFECSAGECIYLAWLCDGAKDCANGEDENAVVCAGREKCTHDQFRCVRSGECVDYSRMCNNALDCMDGSDEVECDSPIPVVAPNDCPPGMQSCDENICYPASKVCDGHRDCYDGSDERACDERAGSAMLGLSVLRVREYETTATTIRVDWALAGNVSTKGMSYRLSYAVVPTDHWIATEWMPITNFTYVFRQLQPYTNYNLTLSLKSADGTVTPSNMFALHRTLTARPEKPAITEVIQLDEKIKVTWVQPHKMNGELLEYIVFMSPPEREWEVKPEAGNAILISAIFKPGVNYTFTVTAVNNHFHGDKSAPAFHVYTDSSSPKQIDTLNVLNYNKDSVTLDWSPVSGASQYHINVKSANPIEDMQTGVKDQYVKGKTKATVMQLSPDTKYTFSVSAMRGEVEGQPKRVMVSTNGRALPKPSITDAGLTPDKGTSVKIAWELPADDKRSNQEWTYGIFYGTNSFDVLSNGAKKIVTGEKSTTIDGLVACESYSFLVAIVGPKKTGPFGPASMPFSVRTKSAAGAAPKNVQAHIAAKNGKLTLETTWDASCPTMSTPMGYMVSITDEHVKKPVFMKLNSVIKTSDINLTLSEHVRYGTTYEIYVQAAVEGAIPSKTVTTYSTPIPTPVQLTHHLANAEELRQAEDDNASPGHLIYWAPPEQLPAYLRQQSFTYKLYLSRNHNMSLNESKVIDVEKPPYLLRDSDLEPGRRYYVAVALVDSEGYTSPLSTLTSLEVLVPDEDIVVSPRGVAGVVVPMIIVVLALGAALGYYVHKNRRITRNFQAFASRYSPASGAAILNQASLDEDDDSPIIRGFSDDEPLVIT